MNPVGVILLVEDSPGDVELTVRALARSNVANPVVVARDGVEALDYLFHRGAYAGAAHVLPQLILLDLNLPKLDGLEVLRAIRLDVRTQLVPVVILTTSVEEQDVLRGYGLGANSYVKKPVNFSEFTEAVRSLGLYWLILNHPPPPRNPAR